MTETMRCGDKLGPIRKLDDIVLVCDEPVGHELPHRDSVEQAWWEPS